VVTDDRQVQFTARAMRAKVCAVAQFGCPKQSSVSLLRQSDAGETKISFLDAQKVNAELEEKWLK